MFTIADKLMFVVSSVCIAALFAFFYSLLFAPNLINAVGCGVETKNDISYSICMINANATY